MYKHNIFVQHTLSDKKVQKLSLGLYLFKRYTFVPKGCILVPYCYILAPKMDKVYLLKRYSPSDSFCSFPHTEQTSSKYTKI